MTTTPRLGIAELAPAQALPEGTVNEHARTLEQGASYWIVKDKDLTAPPGSPVDGDAYIVAASATGAWSGKDGKLAFRLNTGWDYVTPIEGTAAYVQDENLRYLYGGSSWAVDTSGGYTDEQARDAIGAALVAGTGVTITLNDGADTITISATGATSVEALSWKQAVRAASTANVTLASAVENGDSLDGVTLATGDRVLLKNQTTASENGIYTVNASGAPTRATDADAGAELVNAAVIVSEGTTNADTAWICTTNAPITLGSTSLTWAAFGATGAGTLDGLSDVVITSASTGQVLKFNGTNWVNDTDATGGGGGGAWRLEGGPLDSEAPSSNFATLDSRNGHPVLDYDTTTSESAVWTRALPADYAGGGITVNIWCAASAATSGTIGWLVSIERIDASSLDIDADSFASANTVTAVTVPGTSGQVLKMSVNISNGANMDSLAAGELFRIKIARDTANDTATGDAELLRWDMVEQ